MIMYRVIAYGLLLAGLFITGGCAVRSVQPTQLFMLAPLARTMAGEAARGESPPLVIGPIDLPAYTNRLQVLTLRHDTELVAATSARWAEPLDKNFSRVLIENLSRLMGTQAIATLGGLASPASLQVTLEVTEFIATEAGQANLTAYWRVLGGGGRQILVSRKTHYEEAAQGTDYPALVGAMSRTLAALSRDLAQALSAIPDAR
jgi:uncharacterized protein